MSPQWRFLFALLLLYFVLPSSNAQATTNSTSNHTRPATPGSERNKDVIEIRSQIHCYALPYGGLGCASHVLTYYCLVINALGRKPLMPWKQQEYAWLNIIIGTAQLVGSVVSSSLAIARCKGHRDLQLLGIWMILTSIAASVASMLGHGRWMFASRRKAPKDEALRPLSDVQPAATTEPYHLKTYPNQNQQGFHQQYERGPSTEQLVQQEQQKLSKRSFWQVDGTSLRHGGGGQWISWGLIGALWLAGCAMGAVGSVGIAMKVFIDVGPVWKITVGFFGLPVLFLVLWALSCVTITRGKDIRDSWNLLQVTWKVCLMFLVAMLIYMDWLLAAVVGNWWGLPKQLAKDGKILYWVYFGIKRLALFIS